MTGKINDISPPLEKKEYLLLFGMKAMILKLLTVRFASANTEFYQF